MLEDSSDLMQKRRILPHVNSCRGHLTHIHAPEILMKWLINVNTLEQNHLYSTAISVFKFNFLYSERVGLRLALERISKMLETKDMDRVYLDLHPPCPLFLISAECRTLPWAHGCFNLLLPFFSEHLDLLFFCSYARVLSQWRILVIHPPSFLFCEPIMETSSLTFWYLSRGVWRGQILTGLKILCINRAFVFSVFPMLWHLGPCWLGGDCSSQG